VCCPTKAIKLVRSLADFLQGLLECVWLGSVCAEKRVDDPLEETSSCAVGVQDADRRYRHREGRVVFNLVQSQQWLQLLVWPAHQLSKPLLRLMLLCE
jgi:hypothetical protein